jgi:hypothetical protein
MILRRAVAGLLVIVALPAVAEKRPSFLYTPPVEAPMKKALTVEGELENSGPIQKVVIRYRGPAEDYAEAPMELKYGDLYRGEIPAAKMIPPGVEYYVEGVNASGERRALFTNAESPTRVFVNDPSVDAGAPAVDAGPPPPPAKSPPARRRSR